MEFDWLNAGLIVLATIAVVNRIKSEVTLPDWAFTLVSFGVGAVLYVIGLYAPDVVKTIILIGLAASGIFDVTKKI